MKCQNNSNFIDNIKKCMIRVRSDIGQIKWAIVLLLCYGIATQKIFGSVCPMRVLFGLPCPACGMTRAAFSLFCGQWEKVWQYNVLVVLWLAFLIWFGWKRYAKGQEQIRWQVPVILLGILTIGYYVYRMCLIFPGIEPFTYHSKNFVEWLGQMW